MYVDTFFLSDTAECSRLLCILLALVLDLAISARRLALFAGDGVGNPRIMLDALVALGSLFLLLSPK